MPFIASRAISAASVIEITTQSFYSALKKNGKWQSVGSISAAHSSSGILPAKRRLGAWAIDCVCDVMALDNTKDWF